MTNNAKCFTSLVAINFNNPYLCIFFSIKCDIIENFNKHLNNTDCELIGYEATPNRANRFEHFCQVVDFFCHIPKIYIRVICILISIVNNVCLLVYVDLLWLLVVKNTFFDLASSCYLMSNQMLKLV